LEGIRVERAEGVATITLDRPESRNAIRIPMFEEIGRLATELAKDDAVRSVVLTGAGGDFSSGADLTPGEGDASAATPRSAAAGSLGVIRDRIGGAILTLHEMAKPTLAVVSGVAAGAGASLALGCDLVYAAEDARFSFIFVRRALALDCGATWLLPRLIGLQKAKELAFLGDWIGAQEARALGLVTRTFAADELVDAARETALRLAKGPPVALSLIKRGLNASHGLSFAETLDQEARAQAVCTATHDFAEGMKAFLEKREPRYTGG
jgi:2-(1,2-epoxy-1,2-dihydrophenyl)acetyl-CoA isomerase